jgi:hypothetical protein
MSLRQVVQELQIGGTSAALVKKALGRIALCAARRYIPFRASVPINRSGGSTSLFDAFSREPAFKPDQVQGGLSPKRTDIAMAARAADQRITCALKSNGWLKRSSSQSGC